MERVDIQKNNLVALRGTKNLAINCTITTSKAIGPDYRALNITFLHNGSQNEMFMYSTSTKETENIGFKGTLTISSVEYTNSGSYCCVASVSGTTTIKSDCIILTVSGMFNYNHAFRPCYYYVYNIQYRYRDI